MENIKKLLPGLLVSLLLALFSYFLGKQFPIIGGAVFAIILGMLISLFWKDKNGYSAGIKFTSKKILQWAVILLGFGLDLRAVAATGLESLPIIICTISAALIVAFLISKVLHMEANTSTLIGVGSSICGGSAIAATAPVINANDEEVAQAISIVFFFNVLGAVLFPVLGVALGFSQTDGNAFGIFAGTAINDTSSVTAAAATWDSMFGLGSATLDKAVTVKLTRTLAIIPITLVLASLKARKTQEKGTSLKKVFPTFILFFILASLITTICTSLGVSSSSFAPLKELSKFMIVMAMAAIGLNTDLIKLVKTGGKPLVLGFCCSLAVTLTSLLLQHLLHIW